MITILDFGSQYTHLIYRAIRELNIECKIVHYDISANALSSTKGIILSGGPNSIDDNNAPLPDSNIFNLNIPILGICYGMQVICKHFGGILGNDNNLGKSYGLAQIRAESLHDKEPLLDGITQSTFQVWTSHGDYIKMPEQYFRNIASYVVEYQDFAITKHRTLPIYGLRFHPEVSHTEYGKQILSNFTNIGQCTEFANHYLDIFIDNKIAEIQKIVGNKHVILALSGGIDSTVAALITYKAIGAQLHCIMIDNGLLRKDEAQNTERKLQSQLPMKICNYSDLFLDALWGITDPEQKRKIIGQKFIEAFECEAKKIDNVDFLVQGTIYPDVIESGNTTNSTTIKSHHNVGGLPENMHLKLIEPLRELYKDEVRYLARLLGNIDSTNHPFPGPGLAIRIPGEINKEKLEILRTADTIFINALNDLNLYHKLWQAFTILLPVKTVGVMGDNRQYGYACVLRIVESRDGMTASLPKDINFLQPIANLIINQVAGITRVLVDITSKPPGTIEWE